MVVGMAAAHHPMLLQAGTHIAQVLAGGAGMVGMTIAQLKEGMQLWVLEMAVQLRGVHTLQVVVFKVHQLLLMLCKGCGVRLTGWA